MNGLQSWHTPAWSLDRASEVAKLYGIDGCEIYNTTSGLPWNCRPYSGVFFDEMALLGHCLPCMAADDAHHYTGDETRSYIMVQADELTREGVLAAIRANRFYATQGPNFRVEIENGTVTVHTSPVQEVVFFTDTVWAGDRATVGENVTEATYKVQPTDTVRARGAERQRRQLRLVGYLSRQQKVKGKGLLTKTEQTFCV